MEKEKEVQEEITFEQELPSLGKKRSASGEESEDRGRREDSGEGDMPSRGTCTAQAREAGKDTYTWHVQAIVKGGKSRGNELE